MATDEDKINDIKNWARPHNVKEVRSFLGMVGYYRKFVRHFGVISRTLIDLLKKGRVFQWTSECEAAFQTLKTALISAQCLHCLTSSMNLKLKQTRVLQELAPC